MKRLILSLLAAASVTSLAFAADAGSSSSTVVADTTSLSLIDEPVEPIPPFVSTPSVSALIPAADTNGVVVLSLPQSIAIALQQATDVLKSRNALQVNGAALLQAYYQFLPDLNAQANYTWATGKEYYAITTPTQVNTTNRSAAYQLNSTLNLFNGFSDYGNLKASRGRKEAASLSLYRAKQQIILDVTQAYFQVLLDRSIVRIGEENLKASQQREQLLIQQAQVGIRSLADLYRQQAETSADQLYLINARNSARDDLIALLRRLRVDLLNSYDLAEVPFETPPLQDPYGDETHALHTALQNRADLRSARYNAEAAHYDVTTARGGYYPRLDLEGTINGEGETLQKQIVNGVDQLPLGPPQQPLDKQLENQIYYTVGATLNWGLFNRYITKLDVVRADVDAKNARIDYVDEKLLVEGQVRQSVGDYHASLDQMDAAGKGLKYAQESYDAVTTRYGVGASSIVDLLTAQSALVQAEANDVQAKIGFMLEKRIVDNVLGETEVPRE